MRSGEILVRWPVLVPVLSYSSGIRRRRRYHNETTVSVRQYKPMLQLEKRATLRSAPNYKCTIRIFGGPPLRAAPNYKRTLRTHIRNGTFRSSPTKPYKSQCSIWKSGRTTGQRLITKMQIRKFAKEHFSLPSVARHPDSRVRIANLRICFSLIPCSAPRRTRRERGPSAYAFLLCA